MKFRDLCKSIIITSLRNKNSAGRKAASNGVFLELAIQVL